MRTLPLLSAAIVAASLSTAALAADPVTDAMSAAYAPYRTALFRTNGQSQPEALQAMAKTREGWREFTARFGTRPPAPYDRDARFGEALAQVATIFEKADAQIRERNLPAAHETLEAARDVMAELRRRNGVVTFSDHMNAYHAEMEHLLEVGSKLADSPDGLMPLMARAGVLKYLAGRLRTQAPQDYAADVEFVRALEGVEQTVAALEAALLAQDRPRVRDALSNLKRPYSRLFLKFG